MEKLSDRWAGMAVYRWEKVTPLGKHLTNLFKNQPLPIGQNKHLGIEKCDLPIAPQRQLANNHAIDQFSILCRSQHGVGREVGRWTGSCLFLGGAQCLLREMDL